VSDERRAALARVLPDVARHASERERRADEAERELIQWKKVRFMTDKVGDVFDGYITGVAHFGLFVELSDHYVEGLVHVSAMGDDFYSFREGTHTLTGDETGKVYRLGDAVKVQVARVDLERRLIELGLADLPGAVDDRAPRPARRANRPTARREGKKPGARPRAKRVQRPGRGERAARRADRKR
jgi:ribonuclease R